MASRAPAQSTIPIRQLAPAEAISKATVGNIFGVRELSNGQLLVNDAGTRRLILFDSALATMRVVADSSTATHNAYGKRATGIVPYAGDSTLLIDVGARAFLVVTPTGAITRVVSPPRSGDVGFMGNASSGTPGFDINQRLIYRGTMMPSFKAPEAGKRYDPPVIPDSAPILRGDFEKRAADTLAWVRIPKMRITMNTLPGGGVTLSPMINPLATIDDWTLLPDGGVAVLRGQDYHIDWFNADGTHTSTAKMPFDWKRLTEEEKISIIDSTRKAIARQVAATNTATNDAAVSHGAPPSGATGGAVGGHSMTIMPIGAGDGGPAPQAVMNASAAIPAAPEVVPASDLPDYLPPVLRSGNMKADPQGNVWILPSTSAQSAGGLLYDVVNRQGEVFERVRLPAGRALEGFGANGAIYLTSHDANIAHLERSRIQR